MSSPPIIYSRDSYKINISFYFYSTHPPEHALHGLYVCGMCTPVCIHVSECSCRYMHMRACVQARVQARVSLLMCDL